MISPSVGLSSPARMLRRVDFPQPDGPTMQTNSPSLIVRSIFSIAVTYSEFELLVLNFLDKFLTCNFTIYTPNITTNEYGYAYHLLS